MRLAHLAGGDPQLALIADDRVAPLAGWVGELASIDDVLAAGPQALAAIGEVAEAALAAGGRPVEEASFDVPVLRPSKLACVGLNYADHIRETGLPTPESPLIFAKFNSSLLADGAPIRWPQRLTDQVDWEAELVVVIGRRMSGVSEAQALQGVFGYTAGNDVSARDLQFADGQWVRGKSLDSFCPLGPSIVTADEFGDPQSKAIRCLVNGETMQDSTTAEMIFSVAQIISFLSWACTLEPGDVVLTGTPWGVGGFRDPHVFLKAGDEVQVEVEGIGVLRNPVAGPTF